MNHPTDRRSIVANLVWGILMTCLIGSPSGASGQADPPVSEQDIQDLVQALESVLPVPVQDVEDLDVWTRLTWTLRMVVAPGTLAHVRPLYAYDPVELRGETVHPDRIGRVATVKTCDDTETLWCAYYTNETIDAFRYADHLTSSTSGNGGQASEAYFATTYPLPGIEPEKRFVVEQPE